jgi:hypothetical protein
MILLRQVPSVVEIKDGQDITLSNILTITPPATIYSFYLSLISTTLGRIRWENIKYQYIRKCTVQNTKKNL